MPTRRVAGLGLLAIVLSFLTVLAPGGVATAGPPKPSVSIADAKAVTEGNSSAAATFATFAVTLKKENGKRTKVRWTTADGTAKAGQDYVAKSGKLTFSSATAKQVQPITIRVIQDSIIELDEQFKINLVKVKNGVIKRSTATVTITNDDTAPPDRTLTLDTTGTGTGTVTSSPAGVSCNPDCTGTFPHGTVVTLTAAPSASSDFNGFTGDCVDIGLTCQLTMTADKSVHAAFNVAARILTVTKDGTGSGTVMSNPPGIDCGSMCASAFNKGSDVGLSATPAAGSTFTGWSGDCSGTGACAVSMSANRDVTASFADIADFALEVSITGTGSVSSSPAGITCPGDCNQSYESPTSVTLSQSAGSGFQFAGWSGACTGLGSCVVSMTQARQVAASFSAIPTFGLAVGKGGTGKGTVTSEPAGITCGPSCANASVQFAENSSVTLTASPEPNMEFIGWTGDCTGTGSCTVSMTAGRSVLATFMPEKHALSVTKAGTGTGTISGNVSGLDCGQPTCTVDVYEGDLANDQVTLIATATSATSDFAGWSGEGCSGTGNCTVTMTQARSVTATFTLKQRSLTLSIGGSGSVTSSPGSINCPGACSEAFAHGTQVVLTPVAGANQQFFGWVGNGCTGTGSCTVDMTQNRTPTAQFTPIQHTLTVNREGAGTGTVVTSGGSSGINCGSTCSNTYNQGTVVQLTATPNVGSTFAGWTGTGSGPGCNTGSGTTCTVTMSQARSIVANFNVQLRLLTVSKTGTAASEGVVTDTVFGFINCGATCSANYPYGTAVNLHAEISAELGHFTGWTGAGCESVGLDDCVVSMDQARSVSPNFMAVQTLTITKTDAGADDGLVTDDLGLIDCGSNCSAAYPHGTVVTLHAVGTPANPFAGWTGAGCEAFFTGDCAVTMDQARSVSASFSS